jgi:hypothetical protein
MEPLKLREEKFPPEPEDHYGVCEHSVGYYIGNWFNCCICGYGMSSNIGDCEDYKKSKQNFGFYWD